jgi:RNA polymerase sigma factor (sigma-70 family)
MEREVLQRAYFKSESYTEIAADLGRTRERIRQIHEKSLEKLKACLQERGVTHL